MRDRNIEQHWEGHLVNTESTFIFHTLIYFTPKGEREGSRLRQHDTRNTLEFSNLWSRWSESISIPKILINHTLGQNLSFVATPVVNNFERAKISSNSRTSSQSRTAHSSVGPHSWRDGSASEGIYHQVC